MAHFCTLFFMKNPPNYQGLNSGNKKYPNRLRKSHNRGIKSSHAAIRNKSYRQTGLSKLIKAYLIGSFSVTSVSQLSHLIRLPVFDHDGSGKWQHMVSMRLDLDPNKTAMCFLCVLDPSKMAAYTLSRRTRSKLNKHTR